MVRKFAVICLAAAIAGAGASLPAYAGSATSAALNAKEATQLLHKGHLVSQVNELISQTKKQVEMYANMVTNTIGLPVGELLQLKQTAMDMRNLYESAGSLAYGITSDAKYYVNNWQSWFPASSQTGSTVKVAEIADRDAKETNDIIGITGKVAEQAGVTKEVLENQDKYNDMIDEKLKTAEGQKQVAQLIGYACTGMGRSLTNLQRNMEEMKQLQAIELQRQAAKDQADLEAYESYRGAAPQKKEYNTFGPHHFKGK